MPFLANTTVPEDRVINQVDSLPATIADLIAVLTRLDSEISDWKTFTGVKTPGEAISLDAYCVAQVEIDRLKDEVKDLGDQVSSLEFEIRAEHSRQ